LKFALASGLPEVAMPVYEYICQECHASFETILTMKEHETEEVHCPKCDSKRVEQDATEFFAVTSRKS
jgi:putative FmdB family regulatory protein